MRIQIYALVLVSSWQFVRGIRFELDDGEADATTAAAHGTLVEANTTAEDPDDVELIILGLIDKVRVAMKRNASAANKQANLALKNAVASRSEVIAQRVDILANRKGAVGTMVVLSGVWPKRFDPKSTTPSGPLTCAFGSQNPVHASFECTNARFEPAPCKQDPMLYGTVWCKAPAALENSRAEVPVHVLASGKRVTFNFASRATFEYTARTINLTPRTWCDKKLKDVVGWHEGGATKASECPLFLKVADLDKVMSCYATASSMNSNSESFLLPGPPARLDFSRDLEGTREKQLYAKCLKEVVIPKDPNATTRACDVVIRSHMKTLRWISYRDWLGSVVGAIHGMPASTDLPEIVVMRLASGGIDNQDDDDSFLWKSNIWTLANSWASLRLRQGFEGVLMVDAQSGDPDDWDREKLNRCTYTEGLPGRFHAVMLGDVSYSGNEMLNTLDLVMDRLPGRLTFEPARCNFIVGALFLEGALFNEDEETIDISNNGLCNISSGLKIPAHIDAIIADIGTMINSAQGDQALKSVRDWLQGKRHSGQDWLEDRSKENEILDVVAPPFVTQFKIPDHVSFQMNGMFYSILEKKLGKQVSAHHRPRLEPYKKDKAQPDPYLDP